MKTFKQLDLGIQLVLIIGFFIASIINRDETFIIGYFVVGAWQVLSMVIHALNDWFNVEGTARYHYHKATFIIVAIMLLGLIIKPLLCIFVPLLVAAPLMACYYARICYVELYKKMQRPLNQLK